MDITASTDDPNAPAFIAGQIYPMSVEDVAVVVCQMGYGAMLMDGPPDLTRGRRCLKSDAHSAEWEFWTVNGQRVHILICHGMGLLRDYITASYGQGVDPSRPEPQFTVAEPSLPHPQNKIDLR